MRRLVIFAHYDVDGLIADHVIHYLTHLKSVSTDILFASDCELDEGETLKLKGLATLTHASRHHGYDFGSWKKCLEHINFDLSFWDELVVANDSCFAPLYSLEETFSLIGDCDFWGATQEWYSYVKAELRGARDGHLPDSSIKRNLQDIRDDFSFLNSYFMVFRKQVIKNPDFIQFWRSIERQADKAAIIENYEMQLTKLLTTLGYRFSCLATRAGAIFYTKYHVKVPHSYQLPWLRVLLCTRNDERQAELHRCLNKIDYPRHLIDAYMQRMVGTPLPDHYFLTEEPAPWRYKRLAGLWVHGCTYRVKRTYMRVSAFVGHRVGGKKAISAIAKRPDASDYMEQT